MPMPIDPQGRGYDSLYEEFDSPLAKQLRRESYGEDIGQHSWVTADELQQHISALRLTKSSHFLDLGCGPGGPLAYVVTRIGCQASGIDMSANAIAAGRLRAASLGIDGLVEFFEADLNQPIKFASGGFDAVMSLDVILHLGDRLSVFREVARLLAPKGRFLFTDAAIVTGAISEVEIGLRAMHGHTQFAAPGFNEKMLGRVGFRILDLKDHTANLLTSATGRRDARRAHRDELEQLEGRSNFERQQRYLDTVVDLSKRGALSRFAYLTETVED